VSEPESATIGSAAPGHYGAAGSALFLGEATIATAWNVQGDATSSLTAEVQRIAGLALPGTPNTASSGERAAALWLGPSSWLLLAGAAPLGDFADARDALNAAGGALFDVSASRVAYVIGGGRALDVLGCGCPLDFHPRAFGGGQCRQSLYGRVPALFYRRAAASEFTMLVARSFASDIWASLCAAAAPQGYIVREAVAFA
jgi:sarcosine oxidase subunit gamma